MTGLAPARAAGVVALVARRPDERLAGVAAGITIGRPAEAIEPALRDPQTWRAFPGWKKVELLPGPGARVEDDLPLMDLDATYAPQAQTRWVAVEGATRGARLGWTVVPQGARGATLALSSYPRLETTGSVARRFIARRAAAGAGVGPGRCVRGRGFDRRCARVALTHWALPVENSIRALRQRAHT